MPAHFADEHAEWVDLSRFPCVMVVGEVMTERAIERVAAHAAKGGKLVLVGGAGRYCAERPAERDVLRRWLEGMANVKHLPQPVEKAPPPGPASRAEGAFPNDSLTGILRWAGVERPATAETAGFECVRKHSEDGRQVYVGVFRRFPGPYEGIWYDQEVDEKWGRQAARVVVGGMGAGNWNVEKFHRSPGAAATVGAVDGKVVFETEPARVAELQLYRLTRGH